MESGVTTVGVRVFDSSTGSFGVIRYYGPVAGSKNADARFIGVEWDESGRGINNGSGPDGTVYFKCAPKTGSFIHPKRCIPINTVIDAIRARYATPEHEALFLSASNTANKSFALSVEFVGHDKADRELATLTNLRTASANNASVGFLCTPADAKTVSQQLRNVIELELQYNLLRSWLDIALIARSLPRINSLNVSYNRYLSCMCEIAHDNDRPHTGPPPFLFADAFRFSHTSDKKFTHMRDTGRASGDATKGGGGADKHAAPTETVTVTMNNAPASTGGHSNASSGTAGGDSKSVGVTTTGTVAAAAEDPFFLLSNSFRGLSSFSLSGTPNAFTHVYRLCCISALPCLEELHICQNEMTRFSTACTPINTAAIAAAATAAAAASLPPTAAADTKSAAATGAAPVPASASTASGATTQTLITSLAHSMPVLSASATARATPPPAFPDSGATGGASFASQCIAYAQAFSSLRFLNLDDNRFQDWNELQCLSYLPRLEKLLLNDNRITAIKPFAPLPLPAELAFTVHRTPLTNTEPAAAAGVDIKSPASASGSIAGRTTSTAMAAFPGWPNLQWLSLNHNLLDSLSSIETLSVNFPRLSELRLQHNPLTAALGGPVPLRNFIIAFMGPKLQVLNLSQIRSRERSDAEKFYLKHCIKRWKELQQQKTASAATATGAATAAALTADETHRQLSAAYFRFSELSGLYPDTVAAALAVPADGDTPTLAGQLIELTFVDETKAGAAAAAVDSKSAAAAAAAVTKQFTGSTLVSSLKQLVMKQFKVIMIRQVLYYREPKQSAAAIPIADWSPVVGAVTASGGTAATTKAAVDATPTTTDSTRSITGTAAPASAAAAASAAGDVLLDASKSLSFYDMRSGGQIIVRLK